MPGRVQILDGGMGTTLEEDYPEEIKNPLWSAKFLVEKSDAVRNIHERFLEAGARLIQTCNYSTNIDLYETEEIGIAASKRAVDLAHAACARYPDAKVILGLGLVGNRCGAEYNGMYDMPYGPFRQRGSQKASDLPPSHPTFTEAMVKYHLDRLQIFATDDAVWNKIDMIGFETISVVNEGEAIRRAMFELRRQFGKEKPFYISYVFVKGLIPHARVEADFDCRPYRIAEITFAPKQDLAMPFGIGVNCTKPRYCMDVINEFSRAATDLRCISGKTLLAYPDGGGLCYDHNDKTWKPDTDTDILTPPLWAEAVLSFGEKALDAGFEEVILGGCCKAAPGHIKILAETVKKSESK